jgi:hypothetical protein
MLINGILSVIVISLFYYVLLIQHMFVLCIPGGFALLRADGFRTLHVQGAGDRQQTSGGACCQAEQCKNGFTIHFAMF